MTLLINSFTLPIGQLGPDFLFLRETMDHPPTEAMIVLRVDDSERRWRVNLPEGLSAGAERVMIAKA